MKKLDKLLSQQNSLKYAYEMGMDCALHGANTVNCNFEIFNTPERTKEWERGKADAEKVKNAG